MLTTDHLVGFITAYPMNWWLVSRHMKHGMMTVRPEQESVSSGSHESMQESGGAQANSKASMEDDVESVSNGVLLWMTVLSFLVFGLGISIAVAFGGL